MKATFSAREPNILMEAQPGDLFVPLGPDLVECVCAVCSVEDRPDAAPRIAEVWPSNELDPEVRRPVIVLACRVEKGEPEYHPAGFKFYLRGAAPIAFLEQVEPAAFRARAGDERPLNVCIDEGALHAALKKASNGRVVEYSSKPAPCSGIDDFTVTRIARLKPACDATVESTGVPISRL